MFTGAVTDNYWRSTSHMIEDPWAQAVPAQTSGRRRPRRKPAVSEWREWTWREGSMWMVISKQRKGEGGERWCYRERWWHITSVHYNFIPLVKRMVHRSLVSACIVNSSLHPCQTMLVPAKSKRLLLNVFYMMRVYPEYFISSVL